MNSQLFFVLYTSSFNQKTNIMKYFVEYNCKFIAMYKSVKSCISFINKKGLKDDDDNMLRIYDEEGNTYCPITGKIDMIRL